MDEGQFGTKFLIDSPITQQIPGAHGTMMLTPYQQIRGVRIQGGPAGITQGQTFPLPEATDVNAGVFWLATGVFAEIQRRESRWSTAVVAVRNELHALTREIHVLKCEIQRLQQLRNYVVPITTLPSAFKMMRQIPVAIEGDGEDFTATFAEANVSASGETEADAIENFKDALLSSYEVLEGMPSNQLGPVPARQWAILQNVVRRSE